MKISVSLIIFASLIHSISWAQIPGFGGGGGLPSSTDMATLANSLNQTNTSIQNATTAVNSLNTTAGQINQTAGQINQTAGQINQTANRAIDTYEQQMSPQIDRALTLGENVNATVNRLVDPKTLFIAGLAGAAGAALGGFLMNAAISGVEAIFRYLTTDWDQVALETFEANIGALYESQTRLNKLEQVHAQMLANYRLLQSDMFQGLRAMSQTERVTQSRAIFTEAYCNNEINRDQLDHLMSFATELSVFDDPSARLRAELCRVKALMDTYRLSIIQKVATIQASFRRGQHALRERMYEAFDDAAKSRKEYLRERDIRFQRAKVALLNCMRHATGTPSIIERWNAKYCGYRGPETCLTTRQWKRRDPRTGRINETHNCIWECVPPELDDLEHLACPVKVAIPIFGIFSGPKRDCADLRDQIRQRYNVGCATERGQFPVVRQQVEAEIDALPAQVLSQKREVDLRIRTLEHTIQQIQADGQSGISSDQARQQYHDFLNSVCGQ